MIFSWALVYHEENNLSSGLCQNSRHKSEAADMGNADRAYAAPMSPINWANRS
jgi:hypothetical protein